MANELNASVPKITITPGRIDAVVILGATRYGVTVNPGSQSLDAIQTAADTLRKELIEHAKAEIAAELDTLLAPSVKAALKR